MPDFNPFRNFFARLPWYGGIAMACAMIPTSGYATEVKRTLEFDYYLVNGNSLAQIAKNMSSKGPKKKWALTAWTVNSSAGCDVSVDIQVTMPKLLGSGGLSDVDRLKLAKMIIALRAHEMQHVAIATYTAEEIKRHNCVGTGAITKYWKLKNREFDQRTKSGKLEGVTLE
ncbi:DUF922 domain-containing protein [Sulfitobacter sp. F26169L]|uniref:DUF922 domain-containing protein n=1 Tax=Sulfitobacter sp. F26169L TaxID=2996015 RepID=UPI0022608EAA|nr:DUF922 domain-containing protein [Sulfitobacter sp. F26169L]MCX7567815.1 DUF922 domain-containing protein [Sulfitobacter sp. F26169L]